jgi:chaperonin GroEL
MPKILIHGNEARQALAAGVRRLAAAVEPTLGPKGLNAMIDRPVGTPLITRDGVSIASEIELPDRFENMGAQVVREVSMQTNEVAGDGTTTSIVLANGMIQAGVELAAQGARPVDLCHGIDLAVETVVGGRRAAATPAGKGRDEARARLAATNHQRGARVPPADRGVGAGGVGTVV